MASWEDVNNQNFAPIFDIDSDSESDVDISPAVLQSSCVPVLERFSFPSGMTLEAFVNDKHCLFSREFRLCKPLIIDNFVPSEMGVEVLEDAVGRQTVVDCLVAKDNKVMVAVVVVVLVVLSTGAAARWRRWKRRQCGVEEGGERERLHLTHNIFHLTYHH
jgi:hypothetical protein